MGSTMAEPRLTSAVSTFSSLAFGSSLAKCPASATRSSSLRPFSNSDIPGTFRTPSRNRNSWFVRKNSGCPASDGIFGIFELPSSPWHALHSLIRSAIGMSCAADGVLESAAAASANASGRHLPVSPCRKAASLPGIRDPIGCAMKLVRYQQRAVGQLEQVARPAVELILLFVEHAGQERLDGGLGAIRARDGDVVPEPLLTIPRAVACDE